MKRFKVGTDVLFRAILLIVIALILPLMSVQELATTGTIDFEARGESDRTALKSWMAYLIGWVLLPVLLPISIRIILGYVRGYWLEISEEKVASPDFELAIQSISDVRYSFLGNTLKIISASGAIYPVSSALGYHALREVEKTVKAKRNG